MSAKVVVLKIAEDDIDEVEALDVIYKIAERFNFAITVHADDEPLYLVKVEGGVAERADPHAPVVILDWDEAEENPEYAAEMAETLRELFPHERDAITQLEEQVAKLTS